MSSSPRRASRSTCNKIARFSVWTCALAGFTRCATQCIGQELQRLYLDCLLSKIPPGGGGTFLQQLQASTLKFVAFRWLENVPVIVVWHWEMHWGCRRKSCQPAQMCLASKIAWCEANALKLFLAEYWTDKAMAFFLWGIWRLLQMPVVKKRQKIMWQTLSSRSQKYCKGQECWASLNQASNSGKATRAPLKWVAMRSCSLMILFCALCSWSNFG